MGKKRTRNTKRSKKHQKKKRTRNTKRSKKHHKKKQGRKRTRKGRRPSIHTIVKRAFSTCKTRPCRENKCMKFKRRKARDYCHRESQLVEWDTYVLPHLKKHKELGNKVLAHLKRMKLV